LIGLINVFVEINYEVGVVTYNTTKKDRLKILKKFNESVKTYILCNVQVLSEGIDIPKCDMVYVTNPNNNIINLIQRISRCNRIDKDNIDKIGNVLLWTKTDEKIKKITEHIQKYIKVKVQTTNTANQNIKEKNVDVYVKKHNYNQCLFIDEYNKICKASNTYDKILDFDMVVKWLDVEKRNLKRNLVADFNKEIDYVIEKKKIPHKGKSGATYVEIIKITPDCFKCLCMVSQTKKAKEVRLYFLNMEKK
jgi:superfamily II DNA or RNA helicase